MKKLLLNSFILLVCMLWAGFAFGQAPNFSYTGTPYTFTVGTSVGTVLPTTQAGGGAVPANAYGTVSLFAGSTTGAANTTNGTGTAARFNGPSGMTINSAGTQFIADFGNNEIRQITSAGVVTLLAGSTVGNGGRTNGTGNAARFNGPNDITINPATTIMYVADYNNNEVRQVTSAGVVTLLAGSVNGTAGLTNGTTTNARFNGVSGLIYDPTSGTIYVADQNNNEIRQVTTAGVVTLFAGSTVGNTGLTNGTTTAARFNQPASVAVDASGNVYVADFGNNEIRKITPAGVVTLFAGSATGATGSADGTGAAATFNGPDGITVDVSGNLYVSDSNNNTIRMITPAGVVTTIAGNATAGLINGVGTAAEFNAPEGLHIDPTTGNIFVCDNGNNEIREIIGTGYLISPSALPAGLTFNSTTGAITGTPTTVTAATTYTVTGFNITGSFSTTLSIQVKPQPPNITYTTPTVPPYTFDEGITITAAQMPTPTNTGGAIPAGGYAISPGLPAGLTFNTTTGVISGTPTATSTGTYTVTATNTGGSSSYGPFTINVVLPPAPNITYSSPAPAYVFIQNTALTVATDPTPTNTGGPLPSTLAYSFTGTLPIGLAFSTTTGIISGTPTVIAAATSITVTATNAGGTSSATFTITINPKAPVISYTPATYTFYNGVGGTTSAATNTGGTATYSVDASTPFPAYLSIDPTTGIITASTAAVTTAAAVYKIDATNVTGTASANVTITIAGPPDLSYAATPYTFVQGTVTTIPIVNTGGAPTSVYTETGALPTGITFTAASGLFSIAATATIGTYTFTVNASNPAGSSTPSAAAISITINPKAPVISYTPATYTWTTGVGGSTSAATNTGGTATYSFDASTPPPAYLTINSSTGVITASSAATTTAATVYKIDATNVTSTSSANVTITILAPPSFSYSPSADYIDGTAMTLAPAVTVAPSAFGYGTGTLLTIGAITRPWGMAFDAAGNLYVASNNGNAIYKYTGGTGTPATFITTGLTQPTSIAFDASGNIYVGVAAGSVYKYNSTGTTRTTIITGGFGSATQPSSVYGLAVDASGNVYAADFNDGDIYKYTASTATTSILIANGATDMNAPTGVAVDAAGNIYSLDNQADVVAKYNSSGVYQSAVTTGATNPYSLYMNSSGDLYVGDRGRGDVFVYTASGTLLATLTGFTRPLGIAVDANNDLFVSDYSIPSITEYKPVGGYYLNYVAGTTGLPPGITFNNSTGTFSGTPTATFSGTYTVTGYNSAGPFTCTSFTINCVALPAISYPTPESYSLSSTNITPLTPTVTAGAPITGYTITPALPGGLTIDPTTGIISGPPNAASATTTYTITATNAYGTGTCTISITITQPPILSYTNPAPYMVGTAIPSLGPPTNTGGAVAAAGTYAPKTILTNTNGLNNPYGMAVDAGGNLYVANFSASTIVEYSTTGTVTTYSLGANKGPVGIVFDSSGNAYVLEQTARAVVEFAGGNLSGTGTALAGLGLSTTATGIAIDASNNIYIADSGNNNIKKYSGGTVTTITPPNNFFTEVANVTAGIAVDASGNIYVSDNNLFEFNGFFFGSAVDEYNSSGTYVTSYTGSTTPSGISIDSNGNIYLSDTGTGHVTLSTAAFASTTLTETGFTSPRGVISDGKGDFFISDYTANTVTEYAPTGGYSLTGALPPGLSFNTTSGVFTGTPQTVFGPLTLTVTAYNAGGSGSTTVTISCVANPPVISYTPATNVYAVGTLITPLAPAVSGGPIAPAGFNAGTSFATGLNEPWGLTTDAGGNIWVAQDNLARVTMYTTGGVAINHTVAATGNTGIAVDASGNFYVSNANGNVYKYNAAGNLQSTNATVRDYDLFNPSAVDGIAVDASGNLYFTDVSDGIVWKYTASTGITSQLIVTSSPVGVAVDASGNVYVVDQGASKALKEYNSSGVYETTIASGFTTPYSIYRDANGDLYVGDSGTNTIKEYNVLGTLIGTTAATNPRGITMDASGDLYASNYTAGTITKYTPIYYVLSGGTVPAGLAFNTATGTFTGTPTAAFPTTTFTITAYGSDGGPATTPVTITCAYPPSFTYTSPQTYTDGTAIATLSPIFAVPNGGGPITSASVTVNGPLPAGLTLNADGTITGTPTVVTGAITYTITGTNSFGFTGTATVTITCNPQLPIISYTTPDSYNAGTAIAPLTPNNTGGAVASWSISPTLPAGLSFDTTTGIISGTPTTVTAGINYTVTATNITGSATCVVNITITTDAPVITYVTPDTYTVGTLIAPLAPTVTGAGPITYAISPGLPAGLNFDTTTGIITGTPTAVSGAANYVVTATNAGGSGTFTINIACVAAGPVLTYTTPDVFPVNVAITPLSPVNTGTAPVSYAISPGLPTGLNFDTTTGIISGTPTVTSAATTYTITATDGSSNTGTTTISIACSGYVDWIGVTSNDWNDPTNWATNAVPLATDIAGIGVNQTFKNFPTLGPATAATNSVGAVVIGSSSNQVTAGTSATAQAGGIVINTGSILNVTGTVTYQSDANAGTLTAALSGAGTINAAGLAVIANTTLGTPAAYTETMTSSVGNLNLTSNLALTSSVDAGSNALTATFNITGGIVSVAGTIQTSNTAGSTSKIAVTTATLQLANAAPLSGLSAVANSNVVSFNNAGATIEYSGAGQTYYTDAPITGLSTGVTYNSIKFSGSGLKSPNGTNTNNLFVAGDFTNALTTNDAADYIDLSEPTVIFNGATQNIAAGNGTGTTFYNVNFTGASATTIQSGAGYVASAGVLTMSGTSTLAAGGLLTLNSDVNGTATVAAIPAGCSITGNVNVQRFITGGASNYRGYRLISSPVWGSNNGTSNIYSINYLIKTVYLKGQAGIPGGWDGPGNPNVYLFRENLVPSNAGFSAGNFRSVNTLGTGLNFNYLIDGDGGPFNIPVGGGVMFFFRGDRNAAPLATETTVSYIPTSATLSTTGTLNQGQITAHDWYTPTSANLGYTNISGTTAIQGFNFLGNPYASSIDFDQYQTTSPTSGLYAPGTNPFLYILDPTSDNYNVYEAGNGGIGTIVSSMSNVIPSGQGFFVQASSASAQFIFNESAKTNAQANAANGNLLMGHPPAAVVSQYLHLRLLKDSVNTDGMIISFKSSSSPQYNPAEDARYLPGNGQVSISSMSADNVSLAINSMPLPAGLTKQTVIPLTVSALTDGTYQLQMAAVKAIPALYTIWLKDAYRADSLDIRDNPTYIFDILHSDTNSYGAHRFTLVMGQNSALMVHLLSFNANKATGGDEVVWKTENEQNYTNFAVQRSTDGGKTFNVLGGFLSDAQGTYSYLDKAPVMGANSYRLQMTDLNGTITYSNVVTIMYGNTGNQIAASGFIIYPNPTIGPMNLTMNQINATPKYTIQIINNLGAVIQTATSTQPTWQTDVSALMPGTYFVRVTNNSNNTIVGKSAFVKL